ncbi:MAG TPA: diguanylate cyclase [Desulfocapsa sulfexigens]|nr:diguanylate cyclase [Desulfocapsa sulfexigens]
MTIEEQNNPSTDCHLLQQKILGSLSSAPGDFTAQCELLKPFLNRNEKEACTIILYNLVQLTFTRDEARRHWHAIVKHAKKMQSSLDRTLGLTTAACDYFSTVKPSLDNPKLIEFARFEETLKSAHQDFLTGLLSRSAFQNLFEQELSRAKRHSYNTTLIFFDLDSFKQINDQYGHLAGDEALKQVGEILLHSKRKEDVACRFGGDEFVVLLPEINKFMGLLVGKKLLERINKLVIRHSGKDIPINCSGGLASFPLDSNNAKGLMECADRALYQAKSLGTHTISLFSEEKRRFTRIDLQRNVTIRSLKIQKTELCNTSKNISEGGILISCSNKFDIGARLELQIPLQEDSEMTITGSVVRVEQFDTNLYDIGLSFLLLDSTATSSEVIADYMLQQLA